GHRISPSTAPNQPGAGTYGHGDTGGGGGGGLSGTVGRASGIGIGALPGTGGGGTSGSAMTRPTSKPTSRLCMPGPSARSRRAGRRRVYTIPERDKQEGPRIDEPEA